MFDGIAECPANELAPGREILVTPRRIDVVEERLRNLQRDRGHVGVVIGLCVVFGHTLVLPSYYHNDGG